MPDSVLSLGTSLPSIMANTASLSGGKKDDPQKIHHAAQQFESLLISQILKGAHPDESEGWLGTGDDEAASSAMGIAEEQFAQALSARGGLGLATLIEKGLTKSTNGTDS